jgi:hypothetical protein
MDGSAVGLPSAYVGTSDGDTVGVREGELEGSGVGLPSRYVGSVVGDIEGAADGDELG